MFVRFVSATVLAGTLAACAHSVPTRQIQALNVYLPEGKRVSRAAAVELARESAAPFSTQARVMGVACATHTFPLDLTSLLSSGASVVANEVFSESGDGKPLRLIVQLTENNARLACHASFFTSTCNATVDVAIQARVLDEGRLLLQTQASSQRSADADAGGACEGAASAVADAASRATRDVFERVGERLANAPELRR